VLESRTNEILNMQKELKEMHEEVDIRNEELASTKLQIDKTQEEVESLTADLKTRNNIIEEIQWQLTEKRRTKNRTDATAK